ncbi:MAG: CHAD domain-containing protein [Methylocystis sp.]|uniref:CYTH and CHAD domain-containing protein n=1 Tax=Methylocystis sp. TaxID=1911079 RepID=UPI003DA613FE
MPGKVESELKFTFPPEALARVRVALGKETSSSRKRRRLVSRYFDTQDGYLWRHGASLRLRDGGEHRVQTLKHERASALSRDEYEFETKASTPDLKAFEHTPFSRLIKKARVRRELGLQIGVDVSRDVSVIKTARSRIEAALDSGEILSNCASLPFDELELELKEGEPTVLFELARRLCEDAPISLNLISKAERGHLLGDGAWGRSFKGVRPQIGGRMTCAETFRLLCHGCLHDFNINMQALKGPDRVEAIHQGRVALRRLRAALQLFKLIVKDADYQRLDDELKWISHVFGAARDLDVFQEGTFQPASSEGQILGARELADLTEAERTRAHETLNAAVSSTRLRMLLVDLIAWIEGGAWLHANEGRSNEKIDSFATPALRKSLRKFLKRSRNFPQLDPKGQHKVRIRAKKLRYMAGFFKDSPRLVSGPKALKRLLERLEQIQDCLGKVHDDEARAEFLMEQVKRLPADADPVVGFAAGRLAQPAEKVRARRDKAWSAFRAVRKSKPF